MQVAAFYAVRAGLALATAACETHLFGALRTVAPAEVATWTLALSLASAGMYIAAAAFLPSSFAMCVHMLTLAAWLTGRDFVRAVL